MLFTNSTVTEGCIFGPVPCSGFPRSWVIYGERWMKSKMKNKYTRARGCNRGLYSELLKQDSMHILLDGLFVCWHPVGSVFLITPPLGTLKVPY